MPDTINIAPTVPALDGTHLNWLIDRYIAHCRLRLAHGRTVDGYQYQLLWFQQWWNDSGPPRNFLLRPDDFLHFEKYLRGAISRHTQRPLSYHTRHTVLKRLREMFGWALDKGYLERAYAKWVPVANGGKPKRTAARVESLQKLLENAGVGVDRLRNRTIIAMLMGMGLRREELSRLNIEQLHFEPDHSGQVEVIGKRTVANADGTRNAAFDSATGKIIIAYLYEENRREPRGRGPLFTGQRGGRLTGQGVYKVVKRAIKAAQLQKQISGPHDLRRAFATHYQRSRRNNDSGQLLQMQMGHSQRTQTDEYTLLDVDDIRLDLVSPLALFSEE